MRILFEFRGHKNCQNYRDDGDNLPMKGTTYGLDDMVTVSIARHSGNLRPHDGDGEVRYCDAWNALWGLGGPHWGTSHSVIDAFSIVDDALHSVTYRRYTYTVHTSVATEAERISLQHRMGKESGTRAGRPETDGKTEAIAVATIPTNSLDWRLAP